MLQATCIYSALFFSKHTQLLLIGTCKRWGENDAGYRQRFTRSAVLQTAVKLFKIGNRCIAVLAQLARLQFLANTACGKHNRFVKWGWKQRDEAKAGVLINRALTLFFWGLFFT